MKSVINIGAVVFYLACFSLASHAASDPRFFGTYCGDYSERHGLHTYRFDVRASSDYVETAHGNGLVTGSGNISGEGRNIPFVFSGVVMARGDLRGTGIAGTMEPTLASAALSEDGNTVTLRAMDRVISLGKDRCGNNAPAADISAPVAGSFPWGDIIMFSANVTDAEDHSFPAERLVWTSSRDGRLGTGRSIWENDLSTGRHVITFSATDSGGRTATDSVIINVLNNPPNVPRIEEPSPGAVFYAGQEIAFRVRATDREDGYLSDGSLVWRSDRSGRLGTGDLLRRTLSDVGDHIITLAATDHAGELNTASVRITVRSRPADNTPPTVTIISPTNYYAMGDNTCITVVARASDIEDGLLRGESLVWKDRYRPGGRAAGRERTLGTGERIDFCNPAAPAGDTRHTISVTATDSGGLSSINSIVIISIPGGLI